MKRTEEDEWVAGAVRRLKDAYIDEMGRSGGGVVEVDLAMERAIKEAIGARGDDESLDLADEILRRVTETRRRSGTCGVVTEKQRNAWRRAVKTLTNTDYWRHG